MKKTTLLLFALFSVGSFAQQKSTGETAIVGVLTANLTLNNTNSTATLVLEGPSDRWFAVAFGSFSVPGAMTSGNDMVYYNGTTLVDGRHNGQGNTPSADAVNNWTVTGNQVQSGVRTITATRPFVGDGTDYTFNYANNNISLAGAHADSPITATLQYHGGNRDNLGSVPMSILGVEDFSLNASILYPNPSKGQFTIQTKTALQRIAVYTQTGALVKTIEVNALDKTEVNVQGLSTGIYLLELQNDTEKSWKKIVIE